MACFFVGVIGFLVCLVTLLFKVARKKPKKVTSVLMVVFLFIGIMGMVYAMRTPSIESVKADYNKIMNGEMNGKLVELVGDIDNITKYKELYFITISTPDGIYEATTTEDVKGTFPRVGDKRVKMYVTPDYTDDGTLVITIISFRK